jgi:hypothetical protein
VGLKNFEEIGPPNERQGEYRYAVLEVWDCGDPVCDCSQVVVERHYENPLFRGATWFVRVWSGEFFTDGEGSEERKQELMQAFHDMRLRYPNEKWGNVTMPEHPENYPIDHTDDAAIRALSEPENR